MFESPKCVWYEQVILGILRMLMQDTMDFTWNTALNFCVRHQKRGTGVV